MPEVSNTTEIRRFEKGLGKYVIVRDDPHPSIYIIRGLEPSRLPA